MRYIYMSLCEKKKLRVDNVRITYLGIDDKIKGNRVENANIYIDIGIF